jgi:ubiquinone/menaquinone biosynthesis C-methylase UbiE
VSSLSSEKRGADTVVVLARKGWIVDDAQCGCPIESCDIFDFMARHVGMTVIHPGGLDATRRLAESCHLDHRTTVVDIACGKGTSAVYFAERYGCKVVGIDLAEDLIAQAKSLARRKGLEHKVGFQVGDALELPFAENEFDAAISQAMLVLVPDKEKSIREALRVTKVGGYLGWLELSWRKEPTAEFMGAVSDVLCAYCMKNVDTFQGWENTFHRAGVTKMEVELFASPNSTLRGMLGSEGPANMGRVIWRYMTNKRVRDRMKTMNRFFEENAEYFGYGIYVARK